jgi:SAM-dependent methyltransferase
VRGGVQDRVRLLRALVPSPHLGSDAYDIVLSNSLLHHLPDPNALWATVARVGRCSTLVMIVDLVRPGSRESASGIVERYSGNEPDVLKRDFFNSLLAAFTVEEVRAQLSAAGLTTLEAQLVSDRHLLVGGRLPADPQALAQVRLRVPL